MLPNRDNIAGVFSEGIDVTFEEVTSSSSKPQKIPRDKLTKVKFDDFENYGLREWKNYFKMKALEHGVKFIETENYKENNIIEKLRKTFSCWDIKLMMDFVWDAPHDLVQKETMGLWILSSGWINTIYNAAQLWKNGKYTPEHSKNKPKSEWSGTEENSEGRIYI